MSEPAQDLHSAYRKLDPAKPIDGPLLNDYYVERPGDPITLLVEQLKESTQPSRTLVVGQRGVGKTTELNRLAQSLMTQSSLMYRLDLGYSSLENLALCLKELVAKLAVQIGPPNDLLHELNRYYGVGWVADKPPEQLPPLEVSAVILRTVIDWIRAHNPTVRDPVLLIDGWERLPGNDDIFHLMKVLDRIGASVVLVARLSTILLPGYASFRDDWDLVPLPAISIFTHNREPDVLGWTLLKSIIAKRTPGVIWDGIAMGQMIAMSGGIFRDLILMAQHAVLLAAKSGKNFVSAVEVESAIRYQRLKHGATFSPGDQAALQPFARGRRDLIDPSLLQQVNKSQIVAYHEQYLRYDVHPVLWPLLDIPSPRILDFDLY